MAVGLRAKAISAAAESVNEVRLVGRLSGEPTVRTLPSGDEFTAWRLVVDRSPSSAGGRRAPSVDTIDCIAYKRGVQRLATRWLPGQVIEIRGALRRRFWRGPQGPTSRCEVEVNDAKRVRISCGDE